MFCPIRFHSPDELDFALSPSLRGEDFSSEEYKCKIREILSRLSQCNQEYSTLFRDVRKNIEDLKSQIKSEIAWDYQLTPSPSIEVSPQRVLPLEEACDIDSFDPEQELLGTDMELIDLGETPEPMDICKDPDDMDIIDLDETTYSKAMICAWRFAFFEKLVKCAAFLAISEPSKTNALMVRGILSGEDFWQEKAQMGNGGQGKIFKILGPGKTVCVLKMPKPGYSKSCEYEADFLRKCDHKNVVHLLAQTPENCLLLPYGGQDLFDFTVKRGNKRILPNCFKQILQGLSYMHSNNLVYVDLKLENVVLDEKGNVKLIDLGLTRSIPPKTVRPIGGSENYAAPECFESADNLKKLSEILTSKLDIWSFGIFMYTALLGKYPFNVPKNKKPDFNTLLKNVQESQAQLFPEAFVVIQSCLQLDAKKRPTVEQILKMPYFTSLEEPMEF